METNIPTMQIEKRKGPPNRMNDLCYRDWMKFQKSFFRFIDDEYLINEFIQFFTKEKWDDGLFSTSLILTPQKSISFPQVQGNRELLLMHFDTIDEILTILQNAKKNNKQFDFILIDLRHVLASLKSYDQFIEVNSQIFFKSIRSLLKDTRYCTFLIDCNDVSGKFPISWYFALSGRDSLRLRDEKVGIFESKDSLLYCIIMQAIDDLIPMQRVSVKDISFSKKDIKIPAWIIPKSPPRSTSEKLHPAKFPEPLIQGFIDIFSKEHDNIFDPMAGTGSSVIAALRSNRNGYGVELAEDFAKIANRRVHDEQQPSLFDGMFEISKGVVVQGDSRKLDEISELKGIYFDYVITSPPYWSMLQNPGSENQKARREKNLKTVYSNESNDVGNIADYSEFLNTLEEIYLNISSHMKSGAYFTVIVKNVKREHLLYTLAWDLVKTLSSPDKPFSYVGNTLWLQDDIGLKPFAVGIHWVSNILHQYCLHFQKK